MTVVVGVRHQGSVVLGADSGGFSGWDLTVRRDPKVFRLSADFVVGFTTSYRFGQIVRFHLSPPTRARDTDLYDTLVEHWIPGLRRALKQHGYAKVTDNREQAGTMLVGWHDRLFQIEADFQVGEGAEDFSAVGAGASYALGALSVLKGSARECCERALEAADRHCTAVSPPFVYAETRR